MIPCRVFQVDAHRSTSLVHLFYLNLRLGVQTVFSPLARGDDAANSMEKLAAESCRQFKLPVAGVRVLY